MIADRDIIYFGSAYHLEQRFRQGLWLFDLIKGGHICKRASIAWDIEMGNEFRSRVLRLERIIISREAAG